MRAIHMSCAAAALAAVALQSSPAAAQAWIGQIAGQVAAQQAAAAKEKACLEGAPPDPKLVPKIVAKLDKQMEAYFALDSKASPGAIGKVFALREKGVSYRDASGAISPLELGSRLDDPTPALVQTSTVVAGDMQTARAIWTAKRSDGGPDLVYAVDFTGLADPIFGAMSWRIWHMAVLPADQAPNAPGAYCHFDPDQAF